MLLALVRQTIRRLLREPGFSLLAVLTLAFGIGLNVTIFSVVDALLFSPLLVEKPDQLVNIYVEEDDDFLQHGPMAFPDYQDLASSSASFSGMAAHTFTRIAIDVDGEIQLSMGELVTGNYFDLLGIDVYGRALSVSDDLPGNANAVVLSHSAWQRRFGARADILGQEIRLNGHLFTIVGIAPSTFKGLTRGFQPEVWLPFQASRVIGSSASVTSGNATPGLDKLDDRAWRWHWIVGRLAAGSSLESAQSELDSLARGLEEQFTISNEDRRFSLVPTTSVRLLPGVDKALYGASSVVMALVGLVLLIACANLANMMLARAAARNREMATRLALGARRRHVTGQLLIESGVLALVAGVLGLLPVVALGSLARTFTDLVPPELALEPTLDLRVIAFAGLVATATMLLFGLAPALQAAKRDLRSALGDAARGSSGGKSGRRVRNSLVVVQVAMSSLLLICAGLAVRSLTNAESVDPGFGADGAVVASFAPHLQGVAESRLESFYEGLKERLEQQPGVDAVGLASHLPLTFSISAEAAIQNERRGIPVKEWDQVDMASVGPGYFKAIGIEIVVGRAFDRSDHADAAPVLIVNKVLAESFWPGESAVGKRLALGDGGEKDYLVIGVAAQGKYRTLGENPRSFTYQSLAQDRKSAQTVVVRTQRPAVALDAIRAAVDELHPGLAISNLGTLRARIGDALLFPRAAAALFGVFGTIGFLLAGLGIYGVVAYGVSQRTREIGLRMAMGANRHSVLAAVLREGMIVSGIGVGLGLIGASLVTRGLGSILIEVGTLDPPTFLIVSSFLLAVAAVASMVPALRAASVDPMVALRHD